MSNATIIGLRVVRGVDWQGPDQDGDSGTVGTVVTVGSEEGDENPAGTVVVLWDSGVSARYRAGFEKKDDLRIIDNASTGVVHLSVNCNECKVPDMAGIRWKCVECRLYDLCNICYMAGKHDSSHRFYRIDSPWSQSVRVIKRESSVQQHAKGIFSDAKVQRGPDWIYGNQDGGTGKTGRVLKVVNSKDGTTSRSWVRVKWESGNTFDYRRGHDGKVDVKYRTKSGGEKFYVEHLPTLGEYLNNMIEVGDTVRVKMNVLSSNDVDKLTEAGVHDVSGRVLEYRQLVNRLVVRFTVQPNNKYTFPSQYLLKVVSVGDTVKILPDKIELQKLQQGHGGSNAQTLANAGRIGQVVSVDSDGDVKVEIGEKTWIFNPQCCTIVAASKQKQRRANYAQHQSAEDDDSADDEDDGSDAAAFLFNLALIYTMIASADSNESDDLVSQAAQGNIEKVRAILRRSPDQVNAKIRNVTALHVASHGGHVQVVSLLLQSGAKPEITDNNGNTAFHYAADGDEPVVMETLMRFSSTAKDCANVNLRTALHVAVNKESARCVAVLLNNNCNVNVQDSFGDTPLHDAVTKPNATVIDLLLATKKVKFELPNKKGFNVIHHATMINAHVALSKILLLAKNLVNAPADQGNTALHFAAITCNILASISLLEVGRANMEIKNTESNTPLQSAVKSGQLPMIELLVERGADVNAGDSDGDTALHNALHCMNNSRVQPTSFEALMFKAMFTVQPKDILKAPRIFKIFRQLNGRSETVAWLSVACFLVTKEADLNRRNNSSKVPLDLVSDVRVRELLMNFRLIGGSLTTPRVDVVGCRQQ